MEAGARRHRAAVLPFALAALLTTTGVLHFVAERSFESIIPSFLGSPAFWVITSGIAELGCAAALTSRRTRRVAGWACVALFLGVYPANITMAVQSLHGDGSVLLAWLRLPLQVPLVLWAISIARTAQPTGALSHTAADVPADPEPLDGVRH